MDAANKTIRKVFRHVFVLFACLPITWNLAVHAEDGFRLRQLSCTTGTHYVLVSRNFFKVELPNSSLIITSTAPKWNVLTYNTRSKLYCETPLKDFKASYINNTTQIQLTELAMLQEIAAKQRARKIGGNDYIEYPLMIDQDQTWPAFAGAKGARLVVLADPHLPKAAGKILKRICGLNSIKTDQVPIKVEVLTKDGTVSRYLRTIAGSHIAHVETEVTPKGYTRVAKEFDVIRDKQMQSDIKEILDASDHK
jgi:hypothetical protein